MAKLKASARNKLPGKDFAGPKRSYPIEDEAHARDALSRVSANGSSKEKAEVRRKVENKFPGIKQKSAAGREVEKRLNARDKKW
jgi:hypothetical protein